MSDPLDRMAENARELGLDYEPAQPQQEPVGTYGEIFESMRALLQSGRQADQQVYRAMQDKPLYASPPAQRPWVGLTQEERDHIWDTVGNSDAHGDVDGWSGRDVMSAIEAKLKEKNNG